MKRIRVNIVAVEKQQILHTFRLLLSLGIQQVMGIRHFVICGFSDSTIFLHIVS
jgi:hypothetical protein